VITLHQPIEAGDLDVVVEDEVDEDVVKIEVIEEIEDVVVEDEVVLKEVVERTMTLALGFQSLNWVVLYKPR
jgi:hypothetical protein